MRDIQVDDYVIGRNGKPTRVKGVYPQGKLQLYEVVFADGRKVEVCKEHLWESFYVNTTENRRWGVRSTEEMARLISMPNPRVYIPLPDPEDCPEKDFLMDPWLLGALLGDGGISQTDIKITTPDQHIVDKCNEILNPLSYELKYGRKYDYRIVRNSDSVEPMWKYLRRVGIFGKRSWEKEIPWEYLEGSLEQRWKLLQGLLDTDGTIGKEGHITFDTTSMVLADQVQTLVRSLGGIARIKYRAKNMYTYKGEYLAGRPSYRVGIRLKTPSKAFTLPKKKERTNDLNQYSEGLKLRVRSITPTRVDEATCIAVEAEDHLFVVQDYIVTHNTITALMSAAELGYRTAVVLPAMYAEQWYDDIQESFTCTAKDIMFVRGLKNLRSVIQMARNGEYNHDFIIMSSTTMQLLIKEYETDPDLCKEMYCHPAELFELLQCGTRIIDECHRNLHLNIKMDLYTHIEKGINLSATLKTRDPFTTRMSGMIYPKKDRYDGLEYDRYVDVYALEYSMRRAHKAKYKGFKGYYNHTRLEQWLMANPKELDNYCEMIYQIVNEAYVVDRLEGQRCLIFAAFVEFCTYLTKYLQRKITHLKIGRYVSEDDYVSLLANDISVSTILSAGTGVDIPGLREVIMTTSIDSMQANEQAKGRLRRLKDFPDVTPRFWYIYCAHIQKQVDYHLRKQEQFRGTCRYFKQIQTDYTVESQVADFVVEPFLLEGDCFRQNEVGYFDQHVEWIPYDEAA